LDEWFRNSFTKGIRKVWNLGLSSPNQSPATIKLAFLNLLNSQIIKEVKEGKEEGRKGGRGEARRDCIEIA